MGILAAMQKLILVIRCASVPPLERNYWPTQPVPQLFDIAICNVKLVKLSPLQLDSIESGAQTEEGI